MTAMTAQEMSRWRQQAVDNRIPRDNDGFAVGVLERIAFATEQDLHGYVQSARITLLCDALEATERQWAEIAASNAYIDETLKFADAAYQDALARAEKAEAERDALARQWDILAMHFTDICENCPVLEETKLMCGNKCKETLLEWAAVEAAKGETS